MTPQEKQHRSNVRNYACGMTAQEAMAEIAACLLRTSHKLEFNESRMLKQECIAEIKRLSFLAEFFRED